MARKKKEEEQVPQDAAIIVAPEVPEVPEEVIYSEIPAFANKARVLKALDNAISGKENYDIKEFLIEVKKYINETVG